MRRNLTDAFIQGDLDAELLQVLQYVFYLFLFKMTTLWSIYTYCFFFFNLKNIDVHNIQKFTIGQSLHAS